MNKGKQYLINGEFYSYKELGDAVQTLTPISNDEVKEAMNRIFNKVLNEDDAYCMYSDSDEPIIKDSNTITQHISQLESKLTPPTADEIVKELNEYNGEKWEYIEKFKNFRYMKGSNFYYLMGYKGDNTTVLSARELPLKLAHKITSFFMSLEE